MTKTLFGPLLLVCWLSWATALAQFSTDTCCQHRPTPTASVLPPYRGNWQLGLSAGVSNQYQRTLFVNRFFGDPGPWVALSADYFIRPYLGLGAEVGYFGFNLQRQNEIYIRDALTLLNIPLDQAGLLQPANLHSFHLAVGPTLRLALSRRWSAVGSLRGGMFFNDAPITGAFDRTNERLLFRFSPAPNRFQPGLTASAGLERSLTPSFRLGVRAGAFLSRLPYNVDGPNGQFFGFTRALIGYSAQLNAALTLRGRRAGGLPVILPTCYTPILPDPSVTYDVDRQPQPLFIWHSGAPVYATDEAFTLRLYTLPGNKLIDERSTDGRTLAWLSSLKIPDSTAQFYYTIQSTRRDQAGQVCVSPAATGSVRFYKREAVRVDVVRERSPLTVDIYEIRLARPGAVAARPAAPAPRTQRTQQGQRTRRPSTTTRQRTRSATANRRASVPARATAAPATTAVAKPVPPTIEVLIYREVTRRNEVVWPTGIPYPERPTLYLYVLRNEAGVIQGRYTLLVTPGMPGTVRVLSDPERNQFLREAVAK